MVCINMGSTYTIVYFYFLHMKLKEKEGTITCKFDKDKVERNEKTSQEF